MQKRKRFKSREAFRKHEALRPGQQKKGGALRFSAKERNALARNRHRRAGARFSFWIAQEGSASGWGNRFSGGRKGGALRFQRAQDNEAVAGWRSRRFKLLWSSKRFGSANQDQGKRFVGKGKAIPTGKKNAPPGRSVGKRADVRTTRWEAGAGTAECGPGGAGTRVGGGSAWE